MGFSEHFGVLPRDFSVILTASPEAPDYIAVDFPAAKHHAYKDGEELTESTPFGLIMRKQDAVRFARFLLASAEEPDREEPGYLLSVFERQISGQY